MRTVCLNCILYSICSDIFITFPRSNLQSKMSQTFVGTGRVLGPGCGRDRGTAAVGATLGISEGHGSGEELCLHGDG